MKFRIPSIYSQKAQNERRVLHSIFSIYDNDNSGYITPNELKDILRKIYPKEGAEFKIEQIKGLLANELGIKNTHSSNDIAGDGRISFSLFLKIMEDNHKPLSSQDIMNPKITEFMNVLLKYRRKSECDENYLEAERTQKQIDVLKCHEEKRLLNLILSKQLQERESIQNAHKLQCDTFIQEWDTFLNNFDEASKKHFSDLTTEHANRLSKFHDDLYHEMTSKPPKWSRELLDFRKRQQTLAKQKKYLDAQKVKSVTDALEEEDKASMIEFYGEKMDKMEIKFRQQLDVEIKAFHARIESRKRELLLQRDADLERLLRRNKNILVAMESKQVSQKYANEFSAN